jgi:dipeptidyl aminopeptidase/acylaminoacyl peptidase
MRFSFSRLLLASLLSLALPARIAAQVYQNPIPAITRILDAPALPAVLASLDGSKLLLMERPGLPSIAQLTGPELRLAGVLINPRNNAQARVPTFATMVVQPVPKGDPRRIVVPWHARVGTAMWSPTGDRVAFTLLDEGGVSLWLADAGTGAIRMISGPTLNAAFGSPCRWLPSGNGLICLRVVPDRGAPPDTQVSPRGPVVRESEGKPVETGSLDGLEHGRDESLFEYYFGNQLFLIPLSGNDRPIGAAGLHSGFEISPDGRYLLVETVHRPFSHQVPWQRFPRKVEVWDLQGNLLKVIADADKQENPLKSPDAVVTGPRSVAWRTDVPATLWWSEALDGGDPAAAAKAHDRVLMLDAPFTGSPSQLIDLEYRAGEIIWGGKVAIVSEEWQRTRRARTWLVEIRPARSIGRALFDISTEERSADPGRFVTRSGTGGSVLLTSKDQRYGFLSGETGGRPFLDRVELGSGKTLRLWRSEAPYYEAVAAVVDPDQGRFLTRRESSDQPANWFYHDLRKPGAAQLIQLTSFSDPAPEFAGVTRQVVSYQRGDGVQLSGTLYLPPGYDKSKGPLPFVVWIAGKAAAGSSESPNQFTRPEGASPLFLLLAGYGVLDSPTMPIVAMGGKAPNDTYVEQLVANAEAAVAELVSLGVADPKRVAVGGHGGGAFQAVNLLAHTDLFRAGIAESGSYNQTLTPFGFAGEGRSYWQAQAAYDRMSPFNSADRIKVPLLLVHGLADDAAVQSEGLYAALQGLGARARLVTLPAEGLAYQARESVGQVLYEMVAWLERWMK